MVKDNLIFNQYSLATRFLNSTVKSMNPADSMIPSSVECWKNPVASLPSWKESLPVVHVPYKEEYEKQAHFLKSDLRCSAETQASFQAESMTNVSSIVGNKQKQGLVSVLTIGLGPTVAFAFLSKSQGSLQGSSSVGSFSRLNSNCLASQDVVIRLLTPRNLSRFLFSISLARHFPPVLQKEKVFLSFDHPDQEKHYSTKGLTFCML